MKALKALILSNPVSDAGLKHLRGLADLEKLHLCSVFFTNAGLADLLGFKALKELNLSYTQVSGV